MAEEKESMVSMPDGWPVSFSLPKYPASRKEETLEFVDGDEISKTEYASLQPGPCLQACNGSDIQLVCGSSSRPNLAKGKGRYLIVLPGMMSLKSQAKATKTPVIDATRDAGLVEPDDLSQAEEPSKTTRGNTQRILLHQNLTQSKQNEIPPHRIEIRQNPRVPQSGPLHSSPKASR
jgi:hypothetical protein